MLPLNVRLSVKPSTTPSVRLMLLPNRADAERDPYTPATSRRPMSLTEPTDAALPPGHVPTLRVATPDPRDAKRHIRVQSGWAHYHVAACLVDLPKKYSETGSAPVEDIECPRCRQTPEFARAIEQGRNPDTVPRAAEDAAQITPQPTPRTTRPATTARPTKKRVRKEATDQPAAGSQGSLF